MKKGTRGGFSSSLAAPLPPHMDTFLPQGFDEIFKGATDKLVTDARVKCVIVAYEQALKDPKTLMPTTLHAAIEALRRG